MKKIFYPLMLLVIGVCFCHTAWSQSRIISGTVVDGEEDYPLPGVNVLVKGTSTGTVTDIEGNYSLNVPEGAETLIFSSVGYTSEEVAIGNRSEINMALLPDIQALQEVVVTSFGIEQEKQSLGYAVQELQAQEITQTQQPNLVNALQGRVAGVQITNSGGAPGMSSRIIVRGITSLDPTQDNQPLFVVDGVPIDNSTVEAGAGNTPRGLSNRAADINPNDIESINVLKGAAATALYGVRAGNGAVIITTKKGSAGGVKVNYAGTVGFENINKYPDFQEQYGQGFSGAFDPSSFWPSWGAPIVAAQVLDPDVRFYNNTRNVMRTGFRTDNTVSVSGGSDDATFYASIANLSQEGVIPFSNWRRTSAKLSGKANIGNQFNLTGSINYINSGGDRVPHDRIMETLMYWAFTQDATDYINPDGTQRTYGNSNPLYAARFWTFEDDVNRAIGNITLNYAPTEWLSFLYRIGTDFYSDQRTEVQPGPLGIEGELPIDPQGFIEQTRINSRDLNSTLNITLHHEFSKKLEATLRLGNDIFDRSRNILQSRGNEFTVPTFYNVGYTTNITTGQNYSQRRLIGVYGDLQLDYDSFLYLGITGRNDWTSTLTRANRSFFYPAINLSFVFNDVLNLPEVLSYGRLRASYAEVGKDAEPYSTNVTYTIPSDASGTAYFPLNGQVGFTRSNTLGLPTLRPERTASVEVGTDLRFYDDRLSLDVTWYKSNSRDQIISVPVSNATGYTEFVTNAGEIENQGIELILGATPVQLGDFSWDLTVNFSRNRNRIVSIREGIETIVIGSQFGYVGSTVSMQLVEGDPYGNLYGRSYERYYANGVPEDLQYLDRSLPLVIGDNGFPVINTSQLVIGNATPRWIGGIRNTLNYKGLNLSFLIDARAGIDQYDQYGNFYSAFGMLDYSLNRNDVVVFDGVQADGTPNTQEVWLGQGVGPDGINYGAGFYRNYHRVASENFVKDASYVKLRNVSLGYSFASSFLERTPFSAANVALTANNILLWTPWRGFDPESFSAGAGSNATGFTGLGYPGVQSFLFSLNLTL